MQMVAFIILLPTHLPRITTASTISTLHFIRAIPPVNLRDDFLLLYFDF